MLNNPYLVFVRKIKYISKERLALIQLADAVDLLNKGSYISAITLAGAAEEILGWLAKSIGAPAAMEIESSMFKISGYQGNYLSGRNLIRNELKHLGEFESISIVELEEAAYLHISSAITNYKLYKGKLPNATVIRDYCKTRGIS